MLETVSLIAVCSLAALFVLLMVAAYVAYRYTFYVSKKQKHPDPYRVVREGDPMADTRKQLADGILAQSFTDVTVTSRDGLSLHGRIKIVSEGAPFAIMCHGYRSTPLIDFSGGAILAMNLGYNVLLIDQRAHGDSEGKNLTFGVKESRDAIDWANFVKNTYGSDSILFGISMGAATVLMSAGLPEFPECVKGVFADCPFSTAKDIITKEIKHRGMPFPKLAYELARLGARLYGDFDPNAARPIDSVKNAKVPIVLVHGESDTFVPHEMSYAIHIAGNVPLHSFKDAAHGTSYLFEPERYGKIVKEFCSACIPENKNEKEI